MFLFKEKRKKNIGGSLSVIAGSVVYANYRENRVRNLRSPPQEGQATPKSYNYCIQCGIKFVIIVE